MASPGGGGAAGEGGGEGFEGKQQSLKHTVNDKDSKCRNGTLSSSILYYFLKVVVAL